MRTFANAFVASAFRCTSRVAGAQQGAAARHATYDEIACSKAKKALSNRAFEVRQICFLRDSLTVEPMHISMKTSPSTLL